MEKNKELRQCNEWVLAYPGLKNNQVVKRMFKRNWVNFKMWEI